MNVIPLEKGAQFRLTEEEWDEIASRPSRRWQGPPATDRWSRETRDLLSGQIIWTPDRKAVDPDLSRGPSYSPTTAFFRSHGAICRVRQATEDVNGKSIDGYAMRLEALPAAECRKWNVRPWDPKRYA